MQAVNENVIESMVEYNYSPKNKNKILVFLKQIESQEGRLKKNNQNSVEELPRRKTIQKLDYISLYDDVISTARREAGKLINEYELEREASAFEALEMLGQLSLLRVFQKMGVFTEEKTVFNRDRLKQRLGVTPQMYPAFDAFITILIDAGYLSGTFDRLRSTKKLQESISRDRLREYSEKLDFLENDTPEFKPHLNLWLFVKICG